MAKILLLLSTTRESSKGIGAAIKAASAEGCELLVAYVLDDELPGHILQKLTDEGWIGGKPSDELYAAILREYSTQARLKLDDVHSQARNADVPISTQIHRGSFVEKAMDLIKSEGVTEVFVNRRKRSNLSRFLFGSAVAELKKRAPCPVTIIDEDGA